MTAHYQLRGRSVIHPGNVLVQDEEALCYVYFGVTERLSATPIDPTFAEAMLQSYEWEPAFGEQWFTLSELEAYSRDELSRRLSTPGESVGTEAPGTSEAFSL